MVSCTDAAGNNYLTVINRSGLPPIIGEDDDNPKDLYKDKFIGILLYVLSWARYEEMFYL